MRVRSLFFSLALMALAVPALAQNSDTEGWGFRVGLGDDPDQGIFGAQWEITEFAPDLRFIPNVELGFGDDHTILSLTFPVNYMFRDLDVDFVPYAGGGVALGVVDKDKDMGDDDTDFEIALKTASGIEWTLNNRTRFFVELNLVFGDLHDVQAMAGWTFR